MADVGATMEKPFLGRIRSSPPWTLLGYRARREAVAFGVAAVPLILVTLAVVLGPRALAVSMTSPANVQAMFGRFVTAVATASAIAVSVASLTLNRELKGIHTLRERHETNEAFRERLRRATGHTYAPVTLSGFLSTLALTIARDAREVRALADNATLACAEEGVTLARLVDSLERRALETASQLERVRMHPARILEAALDFETDVASHLARRFARESRDEALRGELFALAEQLVDFNIATRYVKTLSTSLVLSNMSWAILVASIPAIFTAAFMMLAYGQGAIVALGYLGAGILVGLAFSIVMLPLGFFVSYVLRVVFLNEHTIPTGGFVLGPDADDMVQPPGPPHAPAQP